MSSHYVLDKHEWRIDGREQLSRGTFENAIHAVSGIQISPGRPFGIYVTEPIDAGHAIAWKTVSYEAELPPGAFIEMRTRFGASAEECAAARWSRKYADSPAKVILAGGKEVFAEVTAARYIQVRVEMHAGNGGTPFLKAIQLTGGLVAPACVGPMHSGIVENGKPVFYWTPIKGTASYALELTMSPDFDGEIFRKDGLTDTFYTYPRKIVDGTYYWRVQAIDGIGGSSDYSPVRQFIMGKRPQVMVSKLKHPYLFFKSSDLPDIGARFTSGHTHAWQAIALRAEDALNASMWDEKELLLSSEENAYLPLCEQVCQGQLEPLSFVYLMSGEEKYAAKAREIMLHLVSFSRWSSAKYSDPSFYYPAWQATEETAHLCRSIATAYDWMYDYLSDEDRCMIREGLLRLGILPLVQSWADPKSIRFIGRHQVPAGRCFGICNSSLGIAAMALLSEVPDARRWMKMSADAVRAFLNYDGGDAWNFDKCPEMEGEYFVRTTPNWGIDGGYFEGADSGGSALLNAMHFIDAFKRVTGEDLCGVVNSKLIDQPLHCIYKDSDGAAITLPFDDCCRSNFSADLYALLAKHTRSGRAKYLLNYSYPAIETACAVVAHDDTVMPEMQGTDKPSKLFSDLGWAIFRSGWENDANLMAGKLKCGRGHQDIGQYVIHYKGRPFVVDSGYAPANNPVYNNYLRTSFAHNLVIVDERPQMCADGIILGYADASGIGIVEADLTAAYQDLVNCWKRTLIYLEPDTFIVIDRLQADTEHKYEWEVHPNGKLHIQPKIGATIYQDQYEMQVRLLSPAEWRVSSKQGYICTEPAEYLSFVPEKPSKEITFLAVFTGAEKGRSVGVSRQDSGKGQAVRVVTPEATHIILTQEDESEISGYGLSARASTCAITKAKADGKCRWVLAGAGPIVENGVEIARASGAVRCRAGSAPAR